MKKSTAIADDINYQLQSLSKDLHDLKSHDAFLGDKGKAASTLIRNLEMKGEN